MNAVIEHVDHFQRRIIQGALQDATASYWRGRAAAFEDARPRPGDYHGRATADDLRAADQRCREAADACHARAATALVDAWEAVA